jgi:hypothetical protein
VNPSRAFTKRYQISGSNALQNQLSISDPLAEQKYAAAMYQ